jgi:hypothetical protein
MLDVRDVPFLTVIVSVDKTPIVATAVIDSVYPDFNKVGMLFASFNVIPTVPAAVPATVWEAADNANEVGVDPIVTDARNPASFPSTTPFAVESTQIKIP